MTNENSNQYSQTITKQEDDIRDTKRIYNNFIKSGVFQVNVYIQTQKNLSLEIATALFFI